MIQQNLLCGSESWILSQKATGKINLRGKYYEGHLNPFTKTACGELVQI